MSRGHREERDGHHGDAKILQGRKGAGIGSGTEERDPKSPSRREASVKRELRFLAQMDSKCGLAM